MCNIVSFIWFVRMYGEIALTNAQPYITFLLHPHSCALCALWDIRSKTLEFHSKVQ